MIELLPKHEPFSLCVCKTYMALVASTGTGGTLCVLELVHGSTSASCSLCTMQLVFWCADCVYRLLSQLRCDGNASLWTASADRNPSFR